jgi:glycine cleavage system transcriptional repressor
MNQRAVLTAIGEDRPGLVEEVTEFLSARGGSVEESRMANLGGQFAIAVLIHGTEAAVDRIRTEIESLAAKTGMHARLTPVRPTPQPTPRSAYRLTARGLDQIGLVHEVASALTRFQLNIESMETTLEPAPHTGAPVFAMDLDISIPSGTDIDAVKRELARVCDSLNIDWQLISL